MSQKHNSPSKLEPAESKVRRALVANPGATAATLASTAGVGRSTATKILSRWAAEGLAVRTDGKDQSVPVTWTLRDDQTDGIPEVADTAKHVKAATGQESDDGAEGEAEAPTPTGTDAKTVPDTTDAPAPAPDSPKGERLPKGGLYDLVKAFLYEHPGESFGPAKIGTLLERSSGAVNNALEKMVTQGLAKKTCDAPKRFSSS